MEDYVGKICPFCKTEITADDEVIVCPECKIPHHKGCWEENKGCTTFGCKEQHYEAQHTNPTDVCVNCGAPIGDGQAFCPKCGTPKGGVKKNVCSKCGAELEEGQEFCPKCGQKAGLVIDAGVNSAINQFNAGVNKKKHNKVIIPVILGVVGVIAAIVLFFVLRGPSVDEIILSTTSLELKVDEVTSVSYTINPEKASNAKVEWKSSNDSVAVVSSNGKITARGEGSCTITVTAGGKTDSLRITVKDGPDFAAVYAAIGGDGYYCTLSSDGSYLSIDTNPLDIDDYSSSSAWSMVQKANNALGLPSSVTSKMSSTRALDGRQTQTYNGITVSWTYHPDQGLQVLYEAG